MQVIKHIRTLHDGWGRFIIATVTSRDGVELTRQIEDHGAAAAVLPYDPARGTVTLVRQPRIGPLFLGDEALLLETPAGLTDGEDPAEAARREVFEETGIRLGKLEPVGAFWPMPGCATERVHCFLASCGEADKIGDGGGVAHEHEDIEVVELAVADACAMARDGRITDMKTTLLLQALQLRYPELLAGPVS
ncbi:NUDIX domain-containing protein [Oricola sp.]|uniref:NUDIX domain-containing protein n=1 Tax=Oricola sp. TaxID=1979950 RepID=UPI003BAB9166